MVAVDGRNMLHKTELDARDDELGPGAGFQMVSKNWTVLTESNITSPSLRLQALPSHRNIFTSFPSLSSSVRVLSSRPLASSSRFLEASNAPLKDAICV